MKRRMRSAQEIKNLVFNNAVHDDRIRAVLLTGSRANHKIKPDKYQDFDIVYIVNDLESFITDHSWTNIFGKRLIWQLPDEMILDDGQPGNKYGFHYLMLFEDGNRIDLTLFPVERARDKSYADSLRIVWLDKDKLFQGIDGSNDLDYIIKQPSGKQFSDSCNEFWWVCTYVAKGLLRHEITYAKEIMEKVVRPMFMRIVEWYIGIESGFTATFGKGGRFMKASLPKAIYNKIVKTYADYHLENNWKALFRMMKLFAHLAHSIAEHMKFYYKISEEKNVIGYLKALYHAQR